VNLILKNVPVTVTFFVKNNALWAKVPGRDDAVTGAELAVNTFSVKNVNGYRLQFEMEGDKAVSFTSTQPDVFLKGM
jgi:hypothetical protein